MRRAVSIPSENLSQLPALANALRVKNWIPSGGRAPAGRAAPGPNPGEQPHLGKREAALGPEGLCAGAQPDRQLVASRHRHTTRSALNACTALAGLALLAAAPQAFAQSGVTGQTNAP